MNDTVNEVTLHLRDLGELFDAPAYRPLDGHAEDESGMDRLLRDLRGRPRGPVRVQILLPAGQLAPDLEDRCRAALRQYCQLRLRQLREQIASLRREGWATLIRGLLFLAACMLGSSLVGEPRYLPAFLGRFVEEGFIIAGWVALWYPLDVLLYQRWPVHRDRRIYEALETMELSFSAAH